MNAIVGARTAVGSSWPLLMASSSQCGVSFEAVVTAKEALLALNHPVFVAAFIGIR